MGDVHARLRAEERALHASFTQHGDLFSSYLPSFLPHYLDVPFLFFVFAVRGTNGSLEWLMPPRGKEQVRERSGGAACQLGRERSDAMLHPCGHRCRILSLRVSETCFDDSMVCKPKSE